MPQRETALKVSLMEFFCDCGHHMSFMSGTHPHYLHKCTKCDIVKGLDRMYPFLKFEGSREENTTITIGFTPDRYTISRKTVSKKEIIKDGRKL